MKAKISILLLLSMLLTACSQTGDPVTTGGSDTTAKTEDTTPKADPLCIDQLEYVDFGGATFRIFTPNNLQGRVIPTTQNHWEPEYEGEVVNDALHDRDLWLEEKYNVKLEYTIDEDPEAWKTAQALYKSVLAGDDLYDLILHDLGSVGKNLTLNGTIYPLNFIETINLDRDYWMPDLNDKLRIGGDLYLSASAISPRFYGSAYIMMFNRDLAENLQFGDKIYDQVAEGKWTIDEMFRYAELASNDIDNDGKMTEADTIGLFYSGLTAESMIAGAGYHYTEYVDGVLKPTLDQPGVVALIEKMVAFFQTDAAYLLYSNDDFDEDKSLSAGRFLFFNPCTFNLAGFRDLECDYGILPMPKLNEEQEEYIAYSNPWASACPMVPVTLVGEGLDRAGTLIDAMAAYGYDYIRPAVFDNVIQLKGTRDDASEKIVSQIFENITFEYATLLNFGQFYGQITNFFTTDLGKQNITTLYASLKTATEAEIEAITTKLADFKAGLK